MCAAQVLPSSGEHRLAPARQGFTRSRLASLPSRELSAAVTNRAIRLSSERRVFLNNSSSTRLNARNLQV